MKSIRRHEILDGVSQSDWMDLCGSQTQREEQQEEYNGMRNMPGQ